jgi:hypothetical protein
VNKSDENQKSKFGELTNTSGSQNTNVNENKETYEQSKDLIQYNKG